MFNEFKSIKKLCYTVLGVTLLLFIVSCEDDHDHDEEHTDAEGFILESSSGTQVYKEFKGTQTGSVTLTSGETLELTVHFLGDDGKELEHDEHEGEEEGELKVSGFNSSIATVEVEEEHGDHGDEEEHEMALEIKGVSAGSTSFKLELMHDGHADYTSTNNVPITVK
ncbi:MAG: hypothetical protein CMG22_03995 [Candidatus Marinimicrobia bacterium]|nr:hypothetical protein [Candidatus Neomarinimicrobiota bacterium]MAQ74385.1 hypothetical protein [Candidatus Neomarinimicrobiota bacterium]|tara:strand:- start:1424 stop:1924 length:501 start_codon:yes stop_codon:yes gene_type:complete